MEQKPSKLKKLIDWVDLDGSVSLSKHAELLDEDTDLHPDEGADLRIGRTISAPADSPVDELGELDDDVPDDLTETYEDSDELDYPDEVITTIETRKKMILVENIIQFVDDEEYLAGDAIDILSHSESVHLSKKQKEQMKRFRAFYLVLSTFIALNLIVVLFLAINYLPEYGAANSPAVGEVYLRYVEQGLADTGALNLVSAVLFSYRSFDTLGEAFVLFTAAISVIVLVYNPKGEKGGKD